MKIQDFFDKIVYINLDHRTDRRELFEQEMTNLGIDTYIRIPGLYADNTEEETNKGRSRHIACGTVHRSIIESAKDGNLDNILIFEDDVTFVENSLEVIEKALDTLQNVDDWDLLYLSGIVIDKELKYFSQNLVNANTILANHAYAINKRAYDRALAYRPKTDCAIDGWFGQQTNNNLVTGSKFKKYLVYPLTCHQRYILSDIDFNSEGVPSHGHGIDPYITTYSKAVVK